MDDNQNKKCPSCGADQPENSSFCGECGAKMSGGPNPDSPTPPANNNFQENQSQNNNQHYYDPRQNPYIYQNPQDAPLSLGEYLLMIIAFGIPFVGLILMIVWSVSASANTNRKNFSRAMLIVTIIGFILSIIIAISMAAFMFTILEEVSEINIPSFQTFNMSVFGCR